MKIKYPKLIYILIFGLTLISYYSYTFSFTFFTVISIIILTGFLVNKNNNFFWKIPKFIIPGLNVYNILYGYSFLILPFSKNIDPKQFIVLPVLYYTLFSTSYIFARIDLKKLLAFVISTHLIFFFVQLLIFHFFGYRIDYVLFFTGEESRNFSGQITTIIGKTFFRPSGLFIEPGTYCVYVAPLLACLKGFLGTSKDIRNIYYLGISSLFLSFSLYGQFFGLILFLMEFSGYIKESFKNLFVRNIKFKDLIILILVLFIIFLIVTNAFTYIQTRFLLPSEASGIVFRQNLITSGIEAIRSESPFWPYLNLGIFNKNSISLDIGFILSYFFVFGIIPYIAIFLFISVNYVKNIRNLFYIFNQKLPILIFFLFTLSSKFNFFTVSGASYLSIVLATSFYIDKKKEFKTINTNKKN